MPPCRQGSNQHSTCVTKYVITEPTEFSSHFLATWRRATYQFNVDDIPQMDCRLDFFRWILGQPNPLVPKYNKLESFVFLLGTDNACLMHAQSLKSILIEIAFEKCFKLIVPFYKSFREVARHSLAYWSHQGSTVGVVRGRSPLGGSAWHRRASYSTLVIW